jgi:integrase
MTEIAVWSPPAEPATVEPVVEAELVEDSTIRTGGSGDLEVSSIRTEVALHPETQALIDYGRRSESTRRAYAGAREAYAQWCEDNKLRPVPAAPNTLANYLRHIISLPVGKNARRCSVSKLELTLSAILTWHTDQRYPKPLTEDARAVINGYRKWLAENKQPAATPKRATPAVPASLRTMLASIDRTTLKGKRDAALLLFGFATAARASELVSVNIGDLQRTDDGLDITLYRKKVKRHTDNVVLYGTDPSTCPVRAVDAYVRALAAHGIESGPLFVRIDRHGRVAAPMHRRGKVIGDPEGRLTPAAVEDVVNKLAAVVELEGKWTSHSLRRGFATAARRAGHDLVRIGRTGGWKDGSESLLKYLEDVDRVTDSPLVGIGL